MTAHTALAIAAYAMRIDGQKASLKMARRATQLAQGQLQALAIEYGSGCEKVVDGRIGSKVREAVGRLKDALVQATPQAQTGDAECRLMNELQSQSRLDLFGSFARPVAYQVPRPQPQQFGSQQPRADQVSHGLVGENLPHPVLDALRVSWLEFGASFTGLGFQRGLRFRAVAIEFFFEGRIPR